MHFVEEVVVNAAGCPIAVKEDERGLLGIVEVAYVNHVAPHLDQLALRVSTNSHAQAFYRLGR